MSRPFKVILITSALAAVAAFATACGTEKITVAKSDPTYAGAVLFAQRCSGCHTLSYAATHGSAANVRTAQSINGPNFNIRCERPITRVLYAIENGGFSGAYMPQNVVVGRQAQAVAQFVATYAGRQAPNVPGVAKCTTQPVGTLPPPTATIAAAATTTTTTASSTSSASHTAAATGSPSGKKPGAAKGKKAKKK